MLLRTAARRVAAARHYVADFLQQVPQPRAGAGFVVAGCSPLRERDLRQHVLRLHRAEQQQRRADHLQHRLHDAHAASSLSRERAREPVQHERRDDRHREELHRIRERRGRRKRQRGIYF